MDIVIPTCGRAGNQPTHDQLEAARIKHWLVVQEHEASAYRQYVSNTCILVVLPPTIRTIAPTRDFIVHHVGGSGKLVMLDDDLTFFARREDEPDKFRDLERFELRNLFDCVEESLGTHAHVGIANREGGNRQTDRLIYNTRILRLLGYRRDVLLKHQINFSAVQLMEDFHVALMLLRLGYPNIIENGYCHNQAGSGAAGGCSHFRTPELHAEMARYLTDLHAPFVRLVTKETKTSFGGGERLDVNIQWKQAYATGIKTYGSRVLDPVP